MEETQFMGLLIGCIATLLGVASAIVAIIIKPIINLNKTLDRLNAHIDELNTASASLKERVATHGNEIDALNLHQIAQDKDIENHEKRITKLETIRRERK